MQQYKHISLVKKNDTYIFRYKSGMESQVIDEFAKLTDNTESDFDWFDAAILSYQIGKRMNLVRDHLP